MKYHEHHWGILSSIFQSRWSAKILGVVLLASTFCGCLSRPPLNIQTYAFSTPAFPATNGPAGHPVLAIKSLQISPPFDGRSFVYRTGEFSYERDPYAGFLSLPAEQLVEPVSEILSQSNRFKNVVAAGNAAQPDVSADITITQLYGDIRKPKAPFAVLAMWVTFREVTNGLPGEVILHRNYARRIPMASTAPAALMAGWNRALVQILDEVASNFRSQEINEQHREDHGGNLSQE
ncbi:MAG TPA: ABC-type transport auxiliary lipoprotein family protein [Verrucomicrobiae bacterium]|nr:ABC-type transport auxiliary lipoprotein family protein [Verrucomicrobiae bacterium]